MNSFTGEHKTPGSYLGVACFFNKIIIFFPLTWNYEGVLLKYLRKLHTGGTLPYYC